MKVYDCFMYYDEDTVVDIRLNCLDPYVDKFIIVESKFTHSGKKRNLLFDINKFNHFKNKISYLVLDHEPSGIEIVDDKDDEVLKSHDYILMLLKEKIIIEIILLQVSKKQILRISSWYLMLTKFQISKSWI